MKTNFNYHTHTALCGHAEGSMEEYVKRAIEGGITHMGFSDHSPYVFLDGHESVFRVPVAKAEEYTSEITALKRKYKDKIDIKIGFEMEYYPTHFERMLETAKKAGAEYLILGQHYLDDEIPEQRHVFFAETEDVGFLKEYVSCIISAVESGVFTYVAHPDMITFNGDKDVYSKEMQKICKASKKHNIPLEINFQGLRNDRSYPNEAFWKIAGEEQCPVTVGFDAHSVYAAYDEKSLDAAEKIIEKYNLNYIGKPHLILL